MAEIRIDIPEAVGLSEDQVTQLREKFRSDLVETLLSKDTGDVLAQARPELKLVKETISKLVAVEK
jgi:hypothetical protein